MAGVFAGRSAATSQTHPGLAKCFGFRTERFSEFPPEQSQELSARIFKMHGRLRVITPSSMHAARHDAGEKRGNWTAERPLEYWSAAWARSGLK